MEAGEAEAAALQPQAGAGDAWGDDLTEAKAEEGVGVEAEAEEEGEAEGGGEGAWGEGGEGEAVEELESDEDARVAVRGRTALALWLGCFPLAPLGLHWRASELLIAAAIAGMNFLVFFLRWDPGSKDSLKSAAKAVGVVMQAMFVPILLPVTRRSVLLWVTHCSYERAVFFHKWSGRWMVVLGLLHTLLMVLVYTAKGGAHGLFKEFTKFNILAGEVAFVLMLAISLLALPWVRRRFYELFMKSHYVLFMLITGLSLLHKKRYVSPHPLALFFSPLSLSLHTHPLSRADVASRLQLLAIVALPLVLYVVDKALQLVYFASGKTKVIRAYAVGEEYVRLEFDWTGNYQPLQWLYIIIPSVSRVQAHPFSIASCPTRRDRMGVLVKVDGDWTAALLRQLQEQPEKLTHVFFDGPHGTLTIRPPNSYRKVLLVAGGSGGPPLLAMLKSTLLNNVAVAAEERTHVTLVWACRTPLLFMEYAEELLYLEERFGSEELSLALHVTQEGADVLAHPLDFRSQDVALVAEGELMVGLQQTARDVRPYLQERVRKGRPDVHEYVAAAAAAAVELGSTRVAIVTCTPRKFTKQVLRAVSRANRFCAGPVRFDIHREVYAI